VALAIPFMYTKVASARRKILFMLTGSSADISGTISSATREGVLLDKRGLEIVESEQHMLLLIENSGRALAWDTANAFGTGKRPACRVTGINQGRSRPIV